MRDFLNALAAASALPCLLAGCATSSGAGGVQAKAATNPGCEVELLTHRFFAGSNVLMTMHVANTGRWCFGGLGLSGVTSSGTRIIDQPAHGQLRLMVREAGVAFGYRPAANYAGSDRFLIRMPGVVGGYETNVAVTVHVTPIVTVAPG